MPRELPGFYFDEEKNRYFPLSSKPNKAPTSHPRPTAVSSQGASERKRAEYDPTQDVQRSRKRRRLNPSALWAEIRSGPSYACRQRWMQSVLPLRVAATSRFSHISLSGPLSSFCVSDAGDRLRCVTGDHKGWLYESVALGGEWGAFDQVGYLPRSFEDLNSRRVAWKADLCLGSDVSILLRLSVLGRPAQKRSFILNLDCRKISDIWTSHLHGPSLALGVRKKAIHIPSLETTQSFTTLDTHSDVFAVLQSHALVYAGARNGSVTRFDTRTPKHQHGHDILNGRYKDRRSSVVHMGLVDEWGMVVNGISGDLEMFDLRFSSTGKPVTTFSGHVNSYTRELGFAIDAASDLLFAAGHDSRIRGWSLRSGELLRPSEPEDQKGLSNPFAAVFEKPVRTLQITHTDGVPMLWANSDKHLLAYPLGRRAAWNAA
ncbi:hypothetical protein GLOTRDRAFT_49552 [Gloeophyllum trabeum ATCC 11539]|uniref:WD40 repeat-like protein n=1 Tax=Gloeophyllum trabeum (strain ATCC 11539 / FP-39264 / Madison 617) TaxID=670483 RepID=S7RF01_GLOTA|nr:uncharacterized protein GLOTRDRAFT_49552 [Gloeophyllum trabeum ATCC 11539]EPQ51049.1 hypothetical protein GLOTRDRAFT_49552 [Gloeophyllum trabeum ATCC 11539]